MPFSHAQSTAIPPVELAPLQSTRLLDYDASVRELSLDGGWQVGLDRHYDRVARVPGLASDPTKVASGTLWYKRTIDLPKGNWTQATLTLKGARFAPQVYLDGVKVSAAEGGMAATLHRFALPAADAAGKTITLEIALQSLKDLDPKDASCVPGADRWRNNVSSYLWDSVILRLHGPSEIARVTPWSDLKADSVSLRWELQDPPAAPGMTLKFKILDGGGRTLVETQGETIQTRAGKTVLDLRHSLEPWSPEHPHLYRLRAELTSGGTVIDAREQSYGLRDFRVDGLGFRLNGEPYPIRMGTVVWHRWSRDPEAKEIAFNPAWFENNVVSRLKSLGANAMRFHLGLPPEKFLDLCDRDGLAVQMEWPFFHGIGASDESMRVQWTAWLDTAMRHPSVVIVHPWNETGGEQVKRATGVLDSVLAEYPPLVVAHRDLTPVHKYWWSLFENVGLYYDSAKQFGSAVMVDEFGGDYLDGKAQPGGYPATRETFLRFLGRGNTAEERLQLQSDANARIAEYWRRLGVAGFSPFCILGSPQDGSHWYLGATDVALATPKPVWAALAAAYAPVSLSLEIWNRNFLPSEKVPVPLYLFNDSNQDQTLRVSIHMVDAVGAASDGAAALKDSIPPLEFQAEVQAHTTKQTAVEITMPGHAGEWRIEARLESPRSATPILSSWRVRTFVPKPTTAVSATVVGVAKEETELRALLDQMHVHVVEPSDPSAKVLVGSRATWQKLCVDPAMLQAFDTRLHQRKSVLLLDAGPQPLGVGYSAGGALGGPLEGAPTVSKPSVLQESTLFGGMHVAFTEVAEPESALQPATESQELWHNVPREATWLWNGLRGGLIVPAADMTITGLSGKAVLSAWKSRGADAAKIAAAGSGYFAYELAGYYAFADRGDDKTVSDQLRKRVRFLVEDAPALQGIVNPDAPIVVTDLGGLYAQGASSLGQAESVTPLANAGKNLSRTPVVKLTFGPGNGSVIVSQLLTAGRLLPGRQESGPGVYGLRYDPVAAQFVLNMLDSLCQDTTATTRPRNGELLPARQVSRRANRHSPSLERTIR